MRAYFGGTGLNIVVGIEDREKDKIECSIDRYKKPKVFLNIVDEVAKNDGFEESGFHMQCWPPNVGLRESTKIHVYLSRKRWHEITTEFDPEADGGFFCSRCKYDRFHINYYDTNMKRQG